MFQSVETAQASPKKGGGGFEGYGSRDAGRWALIRYGLEELIETKDFLAVPDQSVENSPNPLFGLDVPIPIPRVLLPGPGVPGNL